MYSNNYVPAFSMQYYGFNGGQNIPIMLDPHSVPQYFYQFDPFSQIIISGKAQQNNISFG